MRTTNGLTHLSMFATRRVLRAPAGHARRDVVPEARAVVVVVFAAPLRVAPPRLLGLLRGDAGLQQGRAPPQLGQLLLAVL
eukprot:748678-Prorocentrum_minimum.AAC.1